MDGEGDVVDGGRPLSSTTVRFSTSRTGSPGLADVLVTTSCTDAADHHRGQLCSVASAGLADDRPRRITVIRSAIAWTSLSLWVMKTIERPAARSVPHDGRGRRSPAG